MKIGFASDNKGKINELKALLEPLAIDLLPQAELGVSSVPETGLSFVENAILKARHASDQTGLPMLADDSGLEVKVLNGAPGIYSARYAGVHATADDNIKKLLAQLVDVPYDKRQARFYCVLVYLTHSADPTPLICEGEWNGFILPEPDGLGGFGYDPIFFDPTERCSAAALPFHKKNQISHRGKALKQLIKTLPYKMQKKS